MKPIERTAGQRSLTSGEGLEVITADEQRFVLDADAAAVWTAIDGVEGGVAVVAAAQAQHPGLSTRRAWDILDELADAGLLVARAAPPTARGLDRRSVMRVAAGAAAALAVAPLAGRAQNQDDDLLDALLEIPADDGEAVAPEDEFPPEFPEQGEAVDGIDGPEDLDLGPIEAADAEAGADLGEAADDPRLDDPNVDDAEANARRKELLVKRREVFVQRQREREAKRLVRRRVSLERRQKQVAAREELRERYLEEGQKQQARASEARAKLREAAQEQPRERTREARRKLQDRTRERGEKSRQRRTEETAKLRAKTRAELQRQREKTQKSRGEAQQKHQAAQAEWRKRAEAERKSTQARQREERTKRLTLRRKQESALKAERRSLEREAKAGRELRRQEATTKRAAAAQERERKRL